MHFDENMLSWTESLDILDVTMYGILYKLIRHDVSLISPIILKLCTEV